ncbi:PREDICTED: glutamate-rich protein 5 [Myotis davidii]|uniref:glutamate-rich protein 5 n=1 Tax=Myotis davidii TaxID=225400 RepID=UPI0003EBE164|nr:PREDICTED: glutamate-rich protein 5 [Myotis davidii]
MQPPRWPGSEKGSSTHNAKLFTTQPGAPTGSGSRSQAEEAGQEEKDRSGCYRYRWGGRRGCCELKPAECLRSALLVALASSCGLRSRGRRSWLGTGEPAEEESESCFVQPKPRSLGGESTISDKAQKENLPPLEKLKISAASTANGVKSLHDQPLAKDAADPLGSPEKIQPLEGPQESGPLQQDGKDETPGAGGQKDVEAVPEAQPLEGNAETEPLGTEARHQPLRAAGERDSPGAVGDTETPQTAREMKPLRRAGKIPPPEAGRASQPPPKPQLLDTVPTETEAPEILEGHQPVETAEEHQLQETLGRDEQSQLLETMSKGKGFLEISEGSQLVEAAVKNDLIPKTPEGLVNMEQIQPEGIVGSVEHPAGTLGTGTNVEIVRKIHTKKEDQNIEGETGEEVGTGMEKVSERAETKEEETGGAVELPAAI